MVVVARAVSYVVFWTMYLVDLYEGHVPQLCELCIIWIYATMFLISCLLLYYYIINVELRYFGASLTII